MNKDIVEKLNLMAMQNFIGYYGNHVFSLEQFNLSWYYLS